MAMREILKKESPGTSLAIYEPIEETSSFYKNKRDAKEERKSGRGLKGKNPTEIKRAVERIIRYQQNPKKSTTKKGKASAGAKRTPKLTAGQKRSTKKKGMTISAFREYIGWYDQQAKDGKLSLATKKGTPKRSTKKSKSK